MPSRRLTSPGHASLEAVASLAPLGLAPVHELAEQALLFGLIVGCSFGRLCPDDRRIDRRHAHRGGRRRLFCVPGDPLFGGGETLPAAQGRKQVSLAPFAVARRLLKFAKL